MAKHSRKRKVHSKSRTIRRGQYGGNLAGNPASSWGWGLGTLGNGWTQFMNSLSLQPGANLGAVQSNAIVPVGGVNAQTAQGNIRANMTGDIPGQSGGRKHRRRGSKRRGRLGKKGGNVGAILSQAAVPGALILMNNTLGKRSKRRH